MESTNNWLEEKFNHNPKIRNDDTFEVSSVGIFLRFNLVCFVTNSWSQILGRFSRNQPIAYEIKLLDPIQICQ